MSVRSMLTPQIATAAGLLVLIVGHGVVLLDHVWYLN